MQNLTNFIKPELLVLVAALYFIGAAIKKSAVKNNCIPWILGGAGVALSLVWVLATSPLGTYQEVLLAVFTAVVQGVLVAGGSVYVNELITQKKKNSPGNREGK